jgi:hypothetical protein
MRLVRLYSFYWNVTKYSFRNINLTGRRWWCRANTPVVVDCQAPVGNTEVCLFPDQEPDWLGTNDRLFTAVLEYVPKCSLADGVKPLGWKQHRAGIQEEIDGTSFFVAGHEKVRRIIVALVRFRLAKYELLRKLYHIF